MTCGGGGGSGGGGGAPHLSLSWTVAPHTSPVMICWVRPGISSRLAITVILLQFSSGDLALLGEKEAERGGECTDLHISAAVENIQVCKPRPVIVMIPWPNNTNVQQV